VCLFALEFTGILELLLVNCKGLSAPHRPLLSPNPLSLRRLVIHYPEKPVIVNELLQASPNLVDLEVLVEGRSTEVATQYTFCTVASTTLRRVRLRGCSIDVVSTPNCWGCLEYLYLDCQHPRLEDFQTMLASCPRLLTLSLHFYISIGIGLVEDHLLAIAAFCNPGLRDLRLFNISAMGNALKKLGGRFRALRVLLLDVPWADVNFADLSFFIARQAELKQLRLFGLTFGGYVSCATFLDCVGAGLEILDLSDCEGGPIDIIALVRRCPLLRWLVVDMRASLCNKRDLAVIRQIRPHLRIEAPPRPGFRPPHDCTWTATQSD
jgi:hypothetical protein